MNPVFDRQGVVNGKPDNSATFFSARKPVSTVHELALCVRNPASCGKVVDHTWRYFIAEGESLALIERAIAESKTVNDDLKALAAEVGAQHAYHGSFSFENAEAEAVVPQVRLQYIPNEAFVCNATAPGKFFPNLRCSEGLAVRQAIVAMQDLPAAEVQAAREALAKKYKADSFDGTFFHFNRWEEQVESVPAEREKKFRLKSNPAFLSSPRELGVFVPDLETDEGFRIAGKMNEILARQYPERRVAQWISSFELDISYSPRREKSPAAEVEKIGEVWIIKVPAIVAGIYGEDGKGGTLSGFKEGWVLPPGAKPIAISEYFAKLEKSGSLRALPLVVSVVV
ncbi:MAG: hypothetical protein K2W82_17235 [Candidatus Obscuribacterales bacterium]|jgi:hypothetical protein|nr:hypothetical protein [Candidatus Obscuribacterales bacterium]